MRSEELLVVKIVAAIAFVSMNASAQVAATNDTAALDWTGPGEESGCLGRDGLVRAVDEYLGESSFVAGRSERTITVRVARRESFGWRAVVQVKGPDGAVLGDRELVSETDACSSLDGPLTLAVALMVDQELAPSSSDPQKKNPRRERKAKKRQPRASKPETRTRDRSAAVPARGEPEVRLDALLLVALDVLPHPTAGIDVGAELSFTSWFGARVHAVALLPRSQTLDGGAEARLGLLQAGLQACPGATLGRVELGACVGIEAGVLTATTHGFDAGESPDSRFWGGSGMGRARLRMRDGLSLGAAGGALMPYQRDRFVYDFDGESRAVFRTPAVSWWLGAGAALTL